MKTHILCCVTLFALACGSANGEDPGSKPPAPVEAAPAADGVLVQGKIMVPEGAPEAQAVFVSLRTAGRPGPPMAAKRFPAGPFPMDFSLTAADRPMDNGPIPDAFELKVTLDVDGDPMKKTPDDLEAIVSAKKGASDLAVTLAPRP